MALLEAGYDLGAVAGCVILIAFLSIVSFTFARLASALDFSVFGVRPLHHAATAIEHSIVRGCDDGIKALEKATGRFLNGLIDSLAVFLGLALLLGIGVRDALSYLWSHALSPFVHAITNPILTLAQRAEARVVALEGTVARDLVKAENYAEAQAAEALHSAEAYAREQAHAARTAAESFASEAVDKLRAAEDAAVAGALHAAALAERAGIEAAARAETAAEAAAAGALARAETAFDTALGELERITTGAISDLHTLEGSLSPAGIAALIASIPAIAAIVAAIAAEAGLDSAECRGKVKRICGTDPSEWLGLLEGAAFLTGVLSLRELVPIGRIAIRDLRGLIAEAA